ncbi:RNA-directed DNA polymerase from mobile element jockey-like 39 [Homarus americanus]|uniref:RNA-directed DNA polymerase from mobile element jockey-like 39 n=1 Tax=Homarus americanus TaxID=6706 RepID=A0A8J5K850_HOMAM|nr:RNA-directed DNA polymerase from mobile element jockey-like 39 [Homarus americanus]
MHDGMQARVLVSGVQSEPFSVQMGLKQGCVLAPVLFNIFLLAVAQLSHNALGPDAGMGIRYRLDSSLFNIRRLEAYTKTLTTQVIELQYADDCAIMTHNRESMQRALDVISGIYSSLGLQINTQKTEIFFQSIVPPKEAPQFYTNGDLIKIVNQFKYLGSTLTPTCSLDMEIQTRINLASAAFGRLRTRVLLNNDLKYGTKTAVYLAVCISTLLYASETWAPYKRHIQMLENFHTRHLKRIFGISWEDRVTREELYRRSNTTSIETMLAKRHLCWLGPVIRMPDHRLPRQILHGKLSNGNRSAGGQKKEI